MRVAKTVFALGHHRWRISPDTHTPIIAKFTNNALKCCYSFRIIFEQKQRLHYA